MIGYYKADPTTYVLRFSQGGIKAQGAGLSFFYFAPATSIVAVPLASVEAPFMFERVTGDFQRVTAQGQVTYRIVEPERAAQMLDFTLDLAVSRHRSEDPAKLPQRVVNKVDVLMQQELGRMALPEALRGAETIGAAVARRLAADAEIAALGIEVLGLSILAIKPVPETGKALEAEAREAILRRADEALYARRNAAVEQERAIRENELSTEVAVEAKKRQIRETQMDAEIAVEGKKRQVRETQMDAEASIQTKQREIDAAQLVARIGLEEKNRELVGLAATNARVEADARAYGMRVVLESFAVVDPRVVQSLAQSGMQPAQILAGAFQGLAERADKIGQLNVSPDLMRELLAAKE